MSAKDYFQDITPLGASKEPRSIKVTPAAKATSLPELSEEMDLPEKSIRNIQVTPTWPRARAMGEIREAPPAFSRKNWNRYPLWGGVILALLVLGAITLVALRPTTVRVVPRSHSVLFDESALFVAYPAPAATGTLAFTLETETLEDSQVVPAEGTEKVEEKANGTLTVYNEYSSQPVRLIKNTRFETPEGLIFRSPAEVMVPGKRDSIPGEISVTVIADKAGERYNVGPISRFTLPGLKGGDMYAKVYAKSGSAMAGGFVGERPAATKEAIEAARAETRARLQEKIQTEVGVRGTESVIFLDLAVVTFETLPPTAEGGTLRINERARVELPVFSVDNFSDVVAVSVSADAESGSVFVRGLEGLSAQRESSIAPEGAFSFTMKGAAFLVWKVDALELGKALAGRNEAAFQAIVEGFPGVKEAHARIEPFWKNTFPSDSTDIKINIEEVLPST